MPAPPAITDALASVIDIYFSGVRHRERAAFILCDNLVEMTCKTKAKEHNYKFNTACNFHDALKAPGVKLPLKKLGSKVQGYRDTRNNMQHGSAAATVDATYCATAILTAVQVINHCWPNSSSQAFPHWIRVALRVLQLYCDAGEARHRAEFENAMKNQNWRGNGRTNVRVDEMIIQPGNRDYWGTAIRAYPGTVEECLNLIGAPD